MDNGTTFWGFIKNTGGKGNCSDFGKGKKDDAKKDDAKKDDPKRRKDEPAVPAAPADGAK